MAAFRLKLPSFLRENQELENINSQGNEAISEMYEEKGYSDKDVR